VFVGEVTRPEAEEALDALGAHVVTALWEGGNARAVLRPGGVVEIGRGDGCQLVIDHGSVSRVHARLRANEDGTIDIEDLGSTNGVRVAATRIAKNERVTLRPADAIQVGSAMLVVRSPQLPTTEGSAQSATSFESLLALVAPSDIFVLVLGETGVGKNVAATRIHEGSRRAGKPLARINCAAFPESLLEAELFGYERGAFTGAVRSKPGLIEAADGGTVFLDEIGEMPLTTQAKLLGALDSRETQRLGSIHTRRVDVRFIAATNRALPAEVAAGRFRRDLYFRLSAVTLNVPPLRDRRSEIPALVRRLLGELAGAIGINAPSIDPASERLLLSHSWPGNIRELRNALERALVLAGSGTISPFHFDLSNDGGAPSVPPPSSATASAPPPGALREELSSIERERIIEALKACSGNQTRAAEKLGISRRTLINRIEAFKLPRPRRS
jgi:two-component system response regulator AtoC